MEKQIREIAALVERLRRADTDFRVFGADRHWYWSGSTLSEAEIREFEREHEIVLPEDYRLWLQLVGDGSGRKGRWPIAGVGPNYGILHLRDTVAESLPRKPFAPFPFRQPELHWQSEGLKALEANFEDDSDRVCGVLNLGTRGCENETLLVVNGQEQGKIWESWSLTDVWTNGFTFSQWVRNWAERALPMVIRERITDAVEVGMTKAQAIEICGEEWEERPGTTRYRHFRLKNSRTIIEIDESDRVVGLIKHSVGAV